MTIPQRHKAVTRQVQTLVRQAQDLLLDASDGDPCKALRLLETLTVQTRRTSAAPCPRRGPRPKAHAIQENPPHAKR